MDKRLIVASLLNAVDVLESADMEEASQRLLTLASNVADDVELSESDAEIVSGFVRAAKMDRLVSLANLEEATDEDAAEYKVLADDLGLAQEEKDNKTKQFTQYLMDGGAQVS